MARQKTAPPTPASEWFNLPPEAFVCRDVSHAWPRTLALEFFHVERGTRGKVVSLERRMPCMGGCGAVKITPYVLVRGRPGPDPTRRSTVRYTRPYVLRREFPGQELPTRADFAAARLDELEGLDELLKSRARAILVA